jgi:ankyrin repeat protein
VEVSLLLLEAGAAIEAVTRAGETPLFVAAQYPQSLGCVRALCEKGAEVDARDGSNSTPLIVAAHFGNEMVVRALLMAGADRSIMDDDEQTAVVAAENGGHMGLARGLRREEWPIVHLNFLSLNFTSNHNMLANERRRISYITLHLSCIAR